mgnify:CR=1 FL=1
MKGKKKSKPRKIVIKRKSSAVKPKLPKRGMRTKQNIRTRGGRR